jgi:hypothetical protein
MSIALPMKIYAGRMPLNYSDTWQNTFKAMVHRLHGEVDFTSVITGYTGTQTVDYNAGAFWLDPGNSLGQWRVWDDATGQYVPDIRQIGPDGLSIQLKASPTAGQSLTVQDKDGTAALLQDIYAPRETGVLTGATPSANCATTSDFFILLSANTTLTLGNMPESSEVRVTSENLGSKWTLAFAPAGIKWEGGAPGVAPVSTDSSAINGAAIGRFIFNKINSVIYGRLLDFSPSSATPTIDVGGNPPKNYGGGGNSGDIRSTVQRIWP